MKSYSEFIENLKKDPVKYLAYRKKVNATHKRWYQLNYEKQKRKAREYRRELRELSIELGNCTRCYLPNDRYKSKMCSLCSIRYKQYNKNYYNKKKLRTS